MIQKQKGLNECQVYEQNDYIRMMEFMSPLSWFAVIEFPFTENLIRDPIPTLKNLEKQLPISGLSGKNKTKSLRSTLHFDR